MPDVPLAVDPGGIVFAAGADAALSAVFVAAATFVVAFEPVFFALGGGLRVVGFAASFALALPEGFLPSFFAGSSNAGLGIARS